MDPPNKHDTVPQTTAAPSGNLKLRGLLQTSRALARQRQLKKALNNAQIAHDFAIRAGEAPDIAAAAKLLSAEIYLLNASYTGNDELRRQGWRIIEQLEANAVPGSDYISAHELAYAKAVGLRRLGDYAAARRLFERTIDELPRLDPLRAKALVGLAATLAQEGGGGFEGVLREAAEALPVADPAEQDRLTAQLTLARAYEAFERGVHSEAVNYAHQAAKLGKLADAPEITAIASLMIGKLSRRPGNEAISLRFLYEALDGAERMGFRPLLIDAHLAIGHVYEGLTNHREADKYFDFVAEHADEARQPAALFAATLALGKSALRRDDRDDANRRLALALRAAKQSEWLYEQGVAMAELAHLKYREGHAGLAQHLLDEAARQFAEVPNRAPSAKLRLAQAQIAFDREDYEASIARADEGLVLAKAEGRLELAIACLRLNAKALAATQQVSAALEAQQTATELAVGLFQTQRDRQLPDLNMRAALRKQEEQIKELTRDADLKTALFHKNEEIESKNRELVQANEELRQFAYVASHDLKEPVRQIGSYVSLIQRKYAQHFDESGQAFFGFVTEGVTRLNGLLDSLMRYTSVARIDLDPEDIPLGGVVADVEKELASLVEETQARIVTDDLPSVQTTSKLVRHVFYSLVHNALKFRREGAAPVVRISADADSGFFRIAVQDNGIGIQEKYSDKVFVLFQMLQAKTEYEGTGVGLAIAQKAVQRLGGRIWYESNADGSAGTTFFLTLPMGVERQLPVAPAVVGIAEAA